MTTTSGKVLVSTDCTSFSSKVISTASGLTLAGAGVLNGRYVVVGYAGPTGSATPLAWWSDDGTTWHKATVSAAAHDGFVGQPMVGTGGALAVVTQPGYAPGVSSFLRTVDGTSWVSAQSPLGIFTGGEGAGSAAGLLAADGTHVMVAGNPGTNQSAPEQYWIGDGSGTWTQVTLTGSAADLAAAQSVPLPALLPDGLLFGTDTSALVATGTLP